MSKYDTHMISHWIFVLLGSRCFFFSMFVCRMRLLGVLSFLSASCPSKKLSQKAPQHAHRQFILQPATTSLEMPRRSARIRALHASSSSQGNDGEEKRKTKKTRTVPQKKDQKVTRVSSLTLPRTLEFKAYQDSNDGIS